MFACVRGTRLGSAVVPEVLSSSATSSGSARPVAHGGRPSPLFPGESRGCRRIRQRMRFDHRNPQRRRARHGRGRRPRVDDQGVDPVLPELRRELVAAGVAHERNERRARDGPKKGHGHLRTVGVDDADPVVAPETVAVEERDDHPDPLAQLPVGQRARAGRQQRDVRGMASHRVEELGDAAMPRRRRGSSAGGPVVHVIPSIAGVRLAWKPGEVWRGIGGRTRGRARPGAAGRTGASRLSPSRTPRSTAG